MSGPVLPIGNGRGRRREIDWRARGAWLVKLARDLGLTQGESRWCLEGDDGDRVSNNRSTEETWPLDVVLRPLHESGRWGSEASGETRTGVSYSIYKLKNYREVCTTYIREGEREAMTGKVGEPRTVRKRDYG